MRAVLKEKKGPGRGWWGPPKGTHAGQKGVFSASAIAALETNVTGILGLSARSGIEYAVGMDESGKAIGNVIEGTEDRVDLGDLRYQAHIIVHNHPTSASFSGADMGILFPSLSDPREVKTQHLIVAGHDGTIYKLSRTSRTINASAEAVSMAWNDVFKSTLPKYRAKISEEGRPAKDVMKEHTHELTRGAAGQLGLDYERIE